MTNINKIRSNSLTKQLEQYIQLCRSSHQIDDAVNRISQFLAAQNLNEDDAAHLFSFAQTQRDILRSNTIASRIPHKIGDIKAKVKSCFPEKKYRKMPTDKKPQYIKRRRELAHSGMMPRKIAQHFTTGGLATMAVIAQEIAVKGVCTLSMFKLGALAGVCAMTARRAIKTAKMLGLIDVAERKQPRGQKHKTNLVKILNGDWLRWIHHRYKVRGKSTKSMKNILSRFKLKPLSFERFTPKKEQKCYPTLSTNIIYRNLLNADYINHKKIMANIENYHPT